jgi:uncharacterized membrane protein required for colicin V production
MVIASYPCRTRTGAHVSYETLFDALVLLFFVAAFILGFIQGAVRRLIGIAAVVFSLILSAQLSRHVGGFLASNWTQWPASYTFMLAFGGLFALSVILFAIIAETTYERGVLLPRHPAFDPVLGGVLGVIEAAILLGALIIILDSWFGLPGVGDVNGEITVIRDFHNAIDVSQVAHIYRATIIPAVFTVLGGLFPAEIRAVFPH